MHILRSIDRQHFRMDFLVHTAEPSDYDAEIASLGSAVIPCLSEQDPLRYARNFIRILRSYGPYDVVHTHVQHFGALPLFLARCAGVPVRVAHSHSDTRGEERKASAVRRGYLHLTRALIRTYATHGLAVSERASLSLFGPNWRQDRRWQILHCGIDLEAFGCAVDGASLRAELGIPHDALVVGHVGRFSYEKNHTFLVDVAAEVLKREPKAFFLLVGDGPLRNAIQEKVSHLGLAPRFLFTGVRADVSRLMKGAMDLFILPSHFEGLGLVLIEAQAAGLPVVMSDVVPKEVDILVDRVYRMALSQSASDWAQTIVTKLRRRPLERGQALERVRQSPFDIRRSAASLADFYHAAVCGHGIPRLSVTCSVEPARSEE